MRAHARRASRDATRARCACVRVVRVRVACACVRASCASRSSCACAHHDTQRAHDSTQNARTKHEHDAHFVARRNSVHKKCTVHRLCTPAAVDTACQCALLTRCVRWPPPKVFTRPSGGWRIYEAIRRLPKQFDGQRFPLSVHELRTVHRLCTRPSTALTVARP